MNILGGVLACLGVFAVTVAYNFVYAVYQRASADGNAVKAALFDTVLYAMGVISWGALFLIGWWMILPEIVANWLGTYLGTKYANRPKVSKDILPMH